MPPSKFHRLVRFEDSSGTVHYGEAPEQQPSLVGVQVAVYDGDGPWDDGFHLNESKTVEVAKVLSPVQYGAFIYGVGLNYRQHAEEGNFPISSYPVIFIKHPGE